MTPSLPWVPSVRFPSFVGTTSHYDFLPCFPVGFVILRLPGTDSSHGGSCPLSPVTRLRAPCCPMRDPRAWLFCIPQAGAAKADSDTTRSLTFPGYPLVHMPRSQTPAGPRHQALRWFGVAPVIATTKAPTIYTFRGSIARLLNSLSTLHAPESPQEHARLASDCLPGFIGWDWLPTG